MFLFPHQVLPLHVFEPRYRAMVRDLLDRAGRLVIGTTQIGVRERPGQPPALPPVAGLGEILRHEESTDGRFLIWVLGLARVCIEEVLSPHPYRLVQCEAFEEIAVPAAEAAELARQLHAATSARLKEPLSLPETTPPELLTDLLLQTLGAPQQVVERAFAEPSIARRARLALRAARRGEPPRPIDIDHGE